jgi:hypothetical protein
MDKSWTITTLENGQPVGTYILSREDAFRALDWKLRGGSIEDRIRTEKPVETGVESNEQPAEVAVAA